MTLVVGGKDDPPKIQLEITLKSGRTVTRPLHDSFYDEKTRRLRPMALAEWLHLDEASAVNALATSNAQAAAFIDKERLAEQLGVGDDDPLSALPVTLHKGRSGWTIHIKPPWNGLTRLPLGKVTALATKQKISDDAPPTLVATTIADDPGPGPGTGPGTVSSTGAYDQEPDRRGCLGWVADHLAVTVFAAGGVIAFVVLAIFLFGDGDSDSGSDSEPSTGSDTPEVADAGTVAVDRYADTACGIFADNVVEANARFGTALDAASGTTAATPQLYDELAAAATAFAEGLATTADGLEATPDPDVDGGAEAHAQVIDNYRAAADAVTGIADAAEAYDPATATTQDAAALGEAINQGLTGLNDALSDDSASVPEIDAAFEASDTCAALDQ